MNASDAKIEANRQNAQNSTGPKDTTSTRFNAVKHGLLAQGVTELDDHDRYRNVVTELRAEWQPVGVIESFLVNQISLAMLRTERAARIEAEHITAAINPPVTKQVDGDAFFNEAIVREEIVDPGLPASLSATKVEQLVNMTRYETAHENRIYRAVNQLRQLQSERRGSPTPLPNATP